MISGVSRVIFKISNHLVAHLLQAIIAVRKAALEAAVKRVQRKMWLGLM